MATTAEKEDSRFELDIPTGEVQVQMEAFAESALRWWFRQKFKKERGTS